MKTILLLACFFFNSTHALSTDSRQEAIEYGKRMIVDCFLVSSSCFAVSCLIEKAYPNNINLVALAALTKSVGQASLIVTGLSAASVLKWSIKEARSGQH